MVKDGLSFALATSVRGLIPIYSMAYLNDHRSSDLWR
jgi:hypothetical protein